MKFKNNFSIKNVINGLLIGVSNVIPGVSGGTVAVMLGIYETLLGSVKNIAKNFKENVMYLGQIGVGAILGILVFSGIISRLLETHTIAVNYLFIGLVLGSVGLLFSKFKNKNFSLNKISGFILGIGFVFLISTLGTMMGTNTTESIQVGIGSYITLAFAGFITAFTMLLPGVSGSLTLVMMGMYDDFVNAISTFNIPVLIVCGIGVLLGLLFTAKLISFLIERYNDITYSAILGLVFGSIVSIVLANPVGSNMLTAFISVVVGTVLSFGLAKIGK